MTLRDLQAPALLLRERPNAGQEEHLELPVCELLQEGIGIKQDFVRPGIQCSPVHAYLRTVPVVLLWPEMLGLLWCSNCELFALAAF